MRYLRGETLGLFCGELGIRPSSRVLINRSSHGLLVWDLDAGIAFHLDLRCEAIAAEPKVAPVRYRTLFDQPDSILLARLADPDLMPLSEERETLLSELSYRNLPFEKRPSYPLRPMLRSLCAHLASRVNPLRLFRRPSYGA